MSIETMSAGPGVVGNRRLPGQPVDADSSDRRALSPGALAALQPQGRALLSVDGMWCASCAAAVEQVIGRAPGMLDARVSFDGASAVLRWDPERTDLRDVAARVTSLGYRLARPAAADAVAAGIGDAMRAAAVRLALGLFLGVWTMALSVVLYLDAGAVVGSATGQVLAAIATGLAGIAVLASGWPMLLTGWRTLRAGVPGMDTLIALGASAALVLSLARLLSGSDQVYADTAVMLVVLALVGRLVELAATRRATLAIGALQHAVPESAEVRGPGGRWRSVAAEQVSAGALIRVSAGARVPLDGVVVAGRSSLDRSLLTGEPMPVELAPGATVEAGCINLRTPVELRVTHALGDRRIDALGLRIAEALGEKGATQRLADRFARWLVPAALGLAALTLSIGLAAGLDGAEALLRAVSVLVIACPCAVALAVPLTWVAAARRAAEAGVLFRTPRAIEGLAGVRTILFDKTGTLTEGRPRVSDVHAVPGTPKAYVLAWAARAEQGIEHPLAAALRAAVPADAPTREWNDAGWTRERGERIVRLAQRPKGHQRGGIDSAGVAEVLVGSAAALQGLGLPVPAAPVADDQSASRVEVVVNGRWVGRILLRDTIRPDSAVALKALAGAGVGLGLVTGDHERAAAAVADQLAIAPAQVIAGASPEAKAERVGALSHPAAFVGDGINDGIALARSAAGIAVTDAAGTATAAADIVLSGPGLAGVVAAYRLARGARRIMRQNLALAVIYNTGGLLLAAGGAVPPLAAALAMAASSVCVVANAGRVLLLPLALTGPANES